MILKWTHLFNFWVRCHQRERPYDLGATKEALEGGRGRINGEREEYGEADGEIRYKKDTSNFKKLE